MIAPASTAPTPRDRTPTPLPYATLLGFTRYVDRTGPTKATFVGGLRKQRASRSGFNPHGQFVKALKADIAFHTGGTHLTGVADVVKPRWRPLYQALVPGATAWLHSLGDRRPSISPRPAMPWPCWATCPSRSTPTSGYATPTAAPKRSACTSTRPHRARSRCSPPCT